MEAGKKKTHIQPLASCIGERKVWILYLFIMRELLVFGTYSIFAIKCHGLTPAYFGQLWIFFDGHSVKNEEVATSKS